MIAQAADPRRMDNPRLLVTGGAGFIGSQLCERALESGYTVICLDNFDDDYDPAIKERNIATVAGHTRYTLIRGDVLDSEAVETTIRQFQPRCIIHLAALVGVRASLPRPSDYVDVNVKGTVNLLDSAQRNEVAQFIFGSSSSVYGVRTDGPFSEGDAVEPQISPYAATKRSGECFCRTYAELYGIHTTVLRFFTVYGPRQRPGMAIHRFARRLLAGHSIPMYGDGSSIRDYTYVDDIVTGILAAVENPLRFEIINLGSGRPTRLDELIGKIGQALDVRPEIERHAEQLGDVPLLLANVEKARRLLRYEASTFLDEGILRFVAWLKEEAS